MKLVQKKLIYVPTLAGLAVLVSVVAAVLAAVVLGAYPFLAPVRLIPSRVLVVETHVDTADLRTLLAEYRSDTNRMVIAVGGDLPAGVVASNATNFAQLIAQSLEAVGIPAALIHTVYSPSATRVDRTYAKGIAVARHLKEHGMAGQPTMIVSAGPHARRSHYLFRLALEADQPVGILAVPPRDYDPARWWESSAGFRQIINEGTAWIYARFLFWPTRPPAERSPSGAP